MAYNNAVKKYMCKRRSALVSFAPDELIEIIIPNEDDCYKSKKPEDEILLTPRGRGKPRYTRSGRQITSQLERLSLNSPQKYIELSDSDPEEPPGFHVEKPTEQLFDEEDVDGGAIYSFRTPKRQNGMVDKACESVGKKLKPGGFERIRTAEKENPRKAHRQSKAAPQPASPEVVIPKTPYRLRGRFKQRIAKEVEEQKLDNMLEDSGSEYNPTASDTDSNSSESEDAEPLSSPESPPENIQTQSPQTKKTRQPLKDYVFSSDDYFDRRYTKSETSNNTLKKLKRPKMAPSQVASLLKTVPNNHVEAYRSLQRTIESSFNRLMFSISEGYNIMLYGLGSKRDILSKLHALYLKKFFTVEIHGYFPDNMIKEVLSSIASNCLNMKNIPSQPQEIIEAIAEKMKSRKSDRIFILFYNLDGKFIQNDKSQTLISQLVAIPKIHMIATVDHINSALLWDQTKLSAFNFVWEDATTFRAFTEETSYEGSLMVKWSGNMAISSLKNVFTSLTSNSRKVFKILLKHHLENLNPKYQGMHFSDLYHECRSGFVVSSDLALRTLLTEFTDHELVKWKKETDHLYITVDLPVLKQFNSEIASYM